MATRNYTRSHCLLAKQYVRTDKETGKQWIWPAKEPLSKRSYIPVHGLGLAKLTALGHKVRVFHQRWGVYLRQGRKRIEGIAGPVYEPRHNLVIPVGFRMCDDYEFSSYGGYTHIQIKHKETGKLYHLSSECAKEDNFCYKEGVKTALDHLTRDEVDQLLH